MDFFEKVNMEAKRIEEDALFSSRGHFIAGKIWASMNYIIGIPNAIFATTAGTVAVADFNDQKVICATLFFLVAVLSALLAFLNPNQKASEHLNSGNKYNALRNCARIFYNIEINVINEEAALLKLKDLSDRRNELNSDSQIIPYFAYLLAKAGIKMGESAYSVDKQMAVNAK